MTTTIILGLFCTLVVLFFLVKQPLWSLLNVPRQLLHLWQGSAARRNHAIEHATINVLEERYGAHTLDGYSTNEGFRIRGPIDPAMLLDAAREGLLRLQRDDRALAINVRCATTLTTSFLLLNATFMSILATLKLWEVPGIMVTLLLSALGSLSLSRWMQHGIITSMDVKGMSIGSIELIRCRSMFGLALTGAEFAVRTRPARRVYRPAYRYGEHVYVPVEVRHKR